MAGDTTLVFIAGRKGSGKTTLLHVLVDYHLDRYPETRFLVWDRTKEWLPRPRLEVFPATEFTGERAAELAIERAPSVLVLDEVDLCAPNHLGGLQVGTALHAIVHYGRHENVAMLAACRRGANVHADIKALADTLYLFRHTLPRDLAWISDLTSAEYAEEVRRLQPHQFLRYDF